MQAALNSISGIKAELNFISGTLSLELKDPSLEEVALKTVLKLEPQVQIISAEQEPQEDDQPLRSRQILKKITLSGLFFIAGLLFDYYFFPGARLSGVNSIGFWIVFLPYIVAYVISGQDVLESALSGIKRYDFFSEHFLMSIATLGAFFIGEFPEAVAVMLFFKVGEYIEDRAVGHSRRSIKSLLKIRADYANLWRDGKTIQVRPEEVSPGELILVKPGERLPLDGVVLEGESWVDTSALTGESVPRRIKQGDTVLSGMINKNSVIIVKVTRAFEQSTVSRILELVERAAAQKAPTERFITRFSRIYTPVVVSFAVAMAVMPPLLFHQQTYSEWIYRSLVFLVISCPCALVLSIPVGFFGGIGASARRGVLFKGANYLEAFRKVHTMVFDKTGTLTEGVFKVVDIKPFNGFSPEELLRFAALAEAHSNHPIAKSILDAYQGSIDEGSIQSYEEIASHGVRVVAEGREIVAGSDRILHLGEQEIEHETCVTEGTVVHVAVDRRYAGYIVLSDVIREDVESTLDTLRKEGIRRIVMLTGDDTVAARQVAKRLKIEEFYAELLPEEKIEIVKRLKEEMDHRTHKIAFVGDGINDAPVLMASDIGIAMGGLGSDAAIESADVVLMKDRLSALIDALYVSRKTRKIVYENIGMVFLIKGLFLLLGASGMATMWEALFADVGVAVLAVLNSTRVLH